jgi:deaminated glutathione amidase
MVASRKLVVAAAQVRSGTDRAANLSSALTAVRRAADAGARLVVLPEATMASFARNPARSAEPLDGPLASAVREAASHAGVTVVVGLFEPTADGRVHNTLLVTGPAGDAAYRKVHLFDAFDSRESETVAPGEGYVTADVDGGDAGLVRIGLATCYDVRFADQFTALGARGAELVVLPASWGDGPGKAEQWDVLVRARALDAQAWLLAAAQAWQEPVNGAPLGIGRSALVDPLGVVHRQLGAEPDLLVGEVDLDLVGTVRARIPVLPGSGAEE